MQMASSAGGPLRSMQISGGMKGGVLPGMLEMANGALLPGTLADDSRIKSKKPASVTVTQAGFLCRKWAAGRKPCRLKTEKERRTHL